MIEPILLTEAGEILTSGGRPVSATDDAKLSICIGVHDVCNGFVDWKIISASHKAVLCRACGMRVVVPGNVETYGDLREFAERRLS